MEKNFKLFCFGFGQVAKYFVKNLIKNNFDIELITTNTAKTQSNKFGNLKYSYRFVLLPETIGSIAFLSKNANSPSSPFCGRVGSVLRQAKRNINQWFAFS